ncbi:early nodulin-75-like [Haliotis rubra]|uniref:early nodulin-75-like n=1 Tax=Haliotis rubra TaxID=36100 RepID=UPI001EE4EF77|nr:early nodulin-75-like [Haliotis rubra]
MSGFLRNRRPETPRMTIQQVPQMATVVQMSSTRHVSPQYVTPQGTYLPPNGANMTYMTPQGGYVTSSDPPLPQYHDLPTAQYHDAPPPQYQDEPPPQYQDEPPPQYQDKPPPEYQDEPPPQYQDEPPP